MRGTFRSADFPAPLVASAKRGQRISVCIPARDEDATVGQIVTAIRRDLVEAVPVVDEIVVVDDGSSDGTARVAAAAGASVVDAASVLPEYEGHGKGQAMWKGLHSTSGDVIVFCDADIRDFDPAFVLGLAGPLLTRDEITFVKGFYDRPVDGRPGEGGRVTELMARPLIASLFPHLNDLAQPLSGECASRRPILESVPFVGGYGVDLGLLIDVTARFGDAGLVQSDLGVRIHRNRPLLELGAQAASILQAGLVRAGVSGVPETLQLLRPGAGPARIEFAELPPLADVPAHRKSA